MVRHLGLAAGIACVGLAWLLGGRRRAAPAARIRPGALVARQPTALAALEWASLLAGIASRGSGSPLHAFITIVEGNRTGQHLLRLLLLGASFLLRRRRTGRLIRRTGIEGPVVLLLVGQALPHLLMRDGRRYLPKAVRTAAALGMFYALVEGGRRAQTAVAAGIAVNGTLLAIRWPTTWDFAESPAYYEPLQRAGMAINRRLRPGPGPRLQKNRAGGVIAQALPVAIALAWRRPDASPLGTVVFALLAVLSGGGLLLSFSRMSWLAAGGAAVLLGLAGAQRRWFPAPASRAVFWAAALAPVAISGAVLVWTRRLDPALRRLSAPVGSFDSRRDLAWSGIALGRDHVYTGVGHESLTLVLTHYALLHHAPRYAHLHNVYVATWVEDGLLGAAGLARGALTVVRWAWRAGVRPDLPPLAVAGFASLAVAGLMGLGQDHFTQGVKGDYYTTDWVRTRTLLTPAALLGTAAGLAFASISDEAGDRACPRGSWIVPGLGLGLLAAWAARRPGSLVAAWHANAGALLQARIELRRYHPARHDRPLLDQIRREGVLVAAERRFHRALDWDPENATALQRLGAIALARAQYDEAGRLIRRAWGAGHRDRVTVLLYGDVLVAEGRGAEAAALLQSLELAASRLRFQAWYRYEARGDAARAGHARHAAALLEATGHD